MVRQRTTVIFYLLSRRIRTAKDFLFFSFSFLFLFYTVELDRGVVLVRCGIDYGTGILVDKDSGTFLTCSHVVAEVKSEIVLEKLVETRGK